MSTKILKNITSNNPVSCGIGNNPDDICYIDCENTSDNSGVIADCGDAGNCYINCDRQKCLRDGIINATYANSLQIVATAKECLKACQIYLPSNGNATIIVNTGLNGGNDGIAKAAKIYSQSTDYIHFECNDPLKNDNSKDECNEVDIFAGSANYLSVTINGGAWNENSGRGSIQCPYNSIMSPSCIINATNADSIDNLMINAGNGTVPKDIIFYGGISDVFSAVHIFCENNEIKNTYDKITGSFYGTGVCWQNITMPPTTTNASTTVNPTTTSTITTSNPTTTVTTTANPITTSAVTTTVNPIISTANPITSVISTISNPITSSNIQTSNPSNSVSTSVSLIDSLELGTTKSYSIFETNNRVDTSGNINGSFLQQTMANPVLLSIIGVSVAICLILCVFLLFMIRKRANKNKECQQEGQMTDNNLFGLQMNKNSIVEGVINNNTNRHMNTNVFKPQTNTTQSAEIIIGEILAHNSNEIIDKQYQNDAESDNDIIIDMEQEPTAGNFTVKMPNLMPLPKAPNTPNNVNNIPKMIAICSISNEDINVNGNQNENENKNDDSDTDSYDMYTPLPEEVSANVK